MKLFTTEQIKKFFTVLDRMGRETCNRYSDGNFAPCEKEVFVKRTINKWFRGRYVILYATSEQTNAEYKRYLYLTDLSFVLGWGTEIAVNVIDFARPADIFISLKFTHNDALVLEGEWIENPENYHHKLLKLTTLSIPEREFVFKAYDKEEGYLETTVTINAMTEKEAYRKKDEFQRKNPNILVYSII